MRLCEEDSDHVVVILSVGDSVCGLHVAWESEKHMVNEGGVVLAVARMVGGKARGVVHYLEVPQGAAKLIKKLRSCVRWGGAHVEVTHHDHISLQRQTLEVLNEGGNGGLVGFVEVNVDKVSRELEGFDEGAKG